MAIWGALIGAAATAYASKKSSDAAAQATSSANATNWDMWHGANAYNTAEAEKARAFSAESANTEMAYNSAQAAQARDWTKMMSDTSYQRAIGDLKSAGLNPMLAYSQGGASSGGGVSASGAMANSPSASSSAPIRAEPVQKFSNGQLIANTASSFLDIERKLAEIDAIKSSTKKTESDTVGSDWNNKLKENEWKYQVPMLHEKLDQMMTESAEKDFAWKMREKLKDVEEAKRRGELTEQQARTKAIEIGNTISNYAIPGAKNEADFQNTMRGAPQYLKMIQGLLSTAAGVRNLGK